MGIHTERTTRMKKEMISEKQGYSPVYGTSGARWEKGGVLYDSYGNQTGGVKPEPPEEKEPIEPPPEPPEEERMIERRFRPDEPRYTDQIDDPPAQKPKKAKKSKKAKKTSKKKGAK